jgi:hypothetical protein
MERLEVFEYCDEDLIKNLFNAVTYTNNRLSGPAARLLKTLLKKPQNLQMAKDVYALHNWKEWEGKIIQPYLK